MSHPSLPFLRTDHSFVRTQWGRKERFVLAASLTFGMGNMLAPGWFEHLFDDVSSTSKGLNGFLSSITIIISAPCKSPVHFGCSSSSMLNRPPQIFLPSSSAVSSGTPCPTNQRQSSDTMLTKPRSRWASLTRVMLRYLRWDIVREGKRRVSPRRKTSRRRVLLQG